jgi:DNA-binding response OmpR family regulator
MDYVASLRRTIAAQEEKIAYLEGLLAASAEFPILGLSPSQAIILNLLARREQVTKAQFMHALYGERNEDETPPREILAVFISRMRTKLANHGIFIHNVRGVGFKMPRESRARVRAIVQESVRRHDAGHDSQKGALHG